MRKKCTPDLTSRNPKSKPDLGSNPGQTPVKPLPPQTDNRDTADELAALFGLSEAERDEARAGVAAAAAGGKRQQDGEEEESWF